jgi:hypothetical protein
MNCKTLHACLLGLEHPDQPPPEAAHHLAQCVACRDWMQQLLHMERCVPLLPVPPSSGKVRFLAQAARLRKPVASPQPAIRNPHLEEPRWVQHERRLKRLALTSALTAALVLIAVGLLLWRFADTNPTIVKPAPAEDPLLASLMQRNMNLASARTPQQRRR